MFVVSRLLVDVFFMFLVCWLLTIVSCSLSLDSRMLFVVCCVLLVGYLFIVVECLLLV